MSTIMMVKNKLKDAGIDSVYHMVDEKNLSNIFKYGLLSRNEAMRKNIKFEDVSDSGVQKRRENAKGYNLHDYASTYLNPRNAMLYRITKKNKRIVILEISTDFANRMKPSEILVSNQNAATNDAIIRPLTPRLNLNAFLDMKEIYARTWRNDFNNIDYYRRAKMQAEVLVKGFIFSSWIKRCIVQDEEQGKRVQNILKDTLKFRKKELKICVDKDEKFFFEVKK